MSGFGRYCCKSRKLPGDNFPAKSRSDRRSSIGAVSIALPRSPVRLPSGDEVPHIFTRNSRVQPGKFLIGSAKRLLQQYRHPSEVRVAQGAGDLLLVKLSLFPVFNEGVKYTLSDVASVAKVQIWQVVDRFQARDLRSGEVERLQRGE